MSPSAAAYAAASSLIYDLERHGRLDFEVPAEDANPVFSTEYLWTKGSGRMLGVLLAVVPMQHVVEAGGGTAMSGGASMGTGALCWNAGPEANRAQPWCLLYPPAGIRLKVHKSTLFIVLSRILTIWIAVDYEMQ